MPWVTGPVSGHHQDLSLTPKPMLLTTWLKKWKPSPPHSAPSARGSRAGAHAAFPPQRQGQWGVWPKPCSWSGGLPRPRTTISHPLRAPSATRPARRARALTIAAAAARPLPLLCPPSGPGARARAREETERRGEAGEGAPSPATETKFKSKAVSRPRRAEWLGRLLLGPRAPSFDDSSLVPWS